MDFLGVGPLELLVILLLALIVVGPEKLPQLAQTIGKTVNQLRAISNAVTTEWQRELEAVTEVEGEDGENVSLMKTLTSARTDLEEIVAAPASVVSDAKQSIQSPKDVTDTLKSAKSDVEQALSSPSTPAVKTDGSEKASPQSVSDDTAPVSDVAPQGDESLPSEAPVSETLTPDDDGEHVDN